MILDTIIKWAIPTLLTASYGYITKQLHETKKNSHALKDSMVILLRSQIVGKCEKYLEMEYLPDYARSCLEDLFKQYSALGGNHGVGKLVDQCFALPPTKKERR